ncbi:MAG: BlaI/MecI/CopY family transcriptional regulator [Bryobacteraceae bacterium]
MRRLRKDISEPFSTELGPLEASVLNALWKHGESNVRQVVDSLERHLAYTTVMTTLDRLYKKGLLDRRKSERAYHYTARFTQEELEKGRASAFITPFLTGPVAFRDLLVSCFVDAVGEQDDSVLEELERKIHEKRQALRGKDGE